MQCYNHPSTDAVGLCQKCLKAICRDCSVELAAGIACHACSSATRRRRKVIAKGIGIVAVLAVAFSLFNMVNSKQQEQKAAQRVEKGAALSAAGAEQVQKAMLSAIASGELTEEQFFDQNYVLVPNTDPPKYNTQYDQFFDHEVRPILDRMVVEENVVFAVAVDRNGYLPTHNSKFSQPLTGDHDKDRLNNRTKRIFDDFIGLAAARSTEPLVQHYMRDTGEMMADCAVPVLLNGKQWGAMRVGITLK